jgi:hypothetical protein
MHDKVFSWRKVMSHQIAISIQPDTRKLDRRCLPAAFRQAALFLFLVLAVLLSLCPARVHAQMATAEISGTVHDQTAAVVPGATITATLASTGIVETTTSNGEGLFAFSTLPVGSYVLAVTAPGFEDYRQTDIVLTVGERFSVSAGLKVGVAGQVVSVTAADVSLDITTPTQQSIIEQKVVQDLPLNGRNPATFTFTVAGVTDAALNPGNTQSNSTFKENDAVTPQSSAPSVHGARPGGTYFSLDAATNTDPFSVIGGPFPNPDATGEFNVVTGTYGAQYVSAPGGAVNIVTRSGTSQIHGTAFEFLRNGAVNARNYFSPVPDVLKRNQFGFALGGPILKDKLFAFGTYQATPTHNTSDNAGFFPTALERQGNFGTFQIPSYLQSPVAQKILQYLPVGATDTGLVNYQIPQISNDQQGLMKLDYNVAKHRIFARAFYDRYNLASTSPDGPYLAAGEQSGLIIPWLSIAAGDNWSLGNFSLQTTAAFLSAKASSSLGAQNFSYSNLGMTGVSGYPADPGLSLVYVLSAFAVGNGSVTQFPRDTFEVSQNAFAVRGKNQLSFGLNYRHLSLNESNFTGQNPIAVFVGVNSFLDGMFGIIPGATFNPIADLLLGAPYTFYQQDGFYSHQKGNLFGIYAEDNYRLTKKLTLTGGLRWDPYLPYTPQAGHVSCFEPGFQSTVYTNALTGLAFPGDPGCPAAGTHSTLAALQPRVGLAYQFGDSGTTVVRAGYGKYDLQFPLNAYIGFSAQPFVRTYQNSAPFISLDDVWGSQGTTDPFVGGFHTGNYMPPKDVAFIKQAAASSFSPHFHPGYIQQWSLSVQQLISKKDIVDMAYIGTAGTHLTMGVSLNTPVYGPGADQTNEQARRPYQDYANIYQLASIGTSSYNGVDVTYRHRDNNFNLTSAFSWSKALDDHSQPVNAGAANLPDGYNHFQRGRSDFDQNLVFRNTLTYNTPQLKDMNLVTRSILGSWLVSGLVTIDAGQPFSVPDNSDQSYTGLGLDLADRVPSVPLYVNGRLNINAFTNNTPGTFGNSGRNSYRSPSYKDVDVALMKSFPIKERIQVIPRVEAFNLFNHPNLIGPNSSYGVPGTPAAANFGTFTSARDPRILQFSVKASF